jgi:hypothetical protein
MELDPVRAPYARNNTERWPKDFRRRSTTVRTDRRGPLEVHDSDLGLSIRASLSSDVVTTWKGSTTTPQSAQSTRTTSSSPPPQFSWSVWWVVNKLALPRLASPASLFQRQQLSKKNNGSERQSLVAQPKLTWSFGVSVPNHWTGCFRIVESLQSCRGSETLSEDTCMDEPSLNPRLARQALANHSDANR